MNFKLLIVLFLVAVLIMELDARKPPRKGRKGHKKGKGHHHHHHHHHHHPKGSKGKSASFGISFQLGHQDKGHKGKGHGDGGWGHVESHKKGWGLRLPKLRFTKPKIKYFGWRIKLVKPRLVVKGPKLKLYH